jgi:hypothetical protein
MNTPEMPFEYCALRFLIQWEQRERTLHDRIAGNPSLGDIRSALRYFQVARTFKGLKSDEAAQAVADAFLQTDGQSLILPEQKVMTLASRFKDKFNRFNLSASSKLFWLRHKEPYVIFDARAVSALKDLGSTFGNANYSEYCKSWRDQYSRCQAAIKTAASRLPEVKAFLSPWHRTKTELRELASQPWFLERVFDIYLWEIGGKG